MDLNYQRFRDSRLHPSNIIIRIIFTSVIPVWWFFHLDFNISIFRCSTARFFDTGSQWRKKKRKKEKGKAGPATSRDMCYVLNSRTAFSTTSCISRRKRRDCPFLWLQFAQSINARCFFLVSFFSIYICVYTRMDFSLPLSLVLKSMSIYVGNERERKKVRERGNTRFQVRSIEKFLIIDQSSSHSLFKNFLTVLRLSKCIYHYRKRIWMDL